DLPLGRRLRLLVIHEFIIGDRHDELSTAPGVRTCRQSSPRGGQRANLSDQAARRTLVADYFDGWFRPTEAGPLPAVAAQRTLPAAIGNALIQRYTRAELESVLPEELRLEWRRAGAEPGQAETRRDLITGYIEDWSIAQLASLAQQLSTYAEIYKLNQEQLAS